MAAAANVNKDLGTDGGGTSSCFRCNKKVRGGDKALECEICDTWFHTGCEDIPDAVYKFMVEKEAGEQLHWICSFCKRGYDKLFKQVKKLEKQQVDLVKKQDATSEELSTMKVTMGQEIEAVRECLQEEIKTKEQLADRVSSLEAKLMTSQLSNKINDGEIRGTHGNANKLTKNIQGFCLDEAMVEINDRKSRENNIIIFGKEECMIAAVNIGLF